MAPIPPGDPDPLESRWHESGAGLAKALGAALAGAVRRVHTFVLPPGMLGGLYSASFADETAVHRFVYSYMRRALLEREAKPIADATESLRIPRVDGRVEIGRNTGHALHYFLASVDESDPAAVAELRRQRSFEDWLQAAAEPGEGPVLLRVPEPEDPQPVVCASRGRNHYLLRLDGRGSRTIEFASAALSGARLEKLVSESAIARDAMGEWREW